LHCPLTLVLGPTTTTLAEVYIPPELKFIDQCIQKFGVNVVFGVDFFAGG